jgi:CRISPR-associated protein Cas2
MWMLVMFDLPVATKPQRSKATRFRNALLDQGFEMCQLSVYLRFCASKEQVEAYTRKVSKAMPSEGNVQILCFTDKQYENIINFEGGKAPGRRKNPTQYQLF